MSTPARMGAVLLLVGALAGCSPTVAITPAPTATAVGCAAIIVRLPGTLGDQAERQVNAQGTAAWGDPVSVQLRCGVAAPGPTTRTCLTFEGVDWIAEPLAGQRYRLTTFGRSPATEVVIDTAKIGSSTALPPISDAIAAATTQTAHCLGSGGSSGTATPSTAASSTAGGSGTAGGSATATARATHGPGPSK